MVYRFSELHQNWRNALLLGRCSGTRILVQTGIIDYFNRMSNQHIRKLTEGHLRK